MALENNAFSVFHTRGSRFADDHVAYFVNDALQSKVFAEIVNEFPDSRHLKEIMEIRNHEMFIADIVIEGRKSNQGYRGSIRRKEAEICVSIFYK